MLLFSAQYFCKGHTHSFGNVGSLADFDFNKDEDELSSLYFTSSPTVLTCLTIIPCFGPLTISSLQLFLGSCNVRFDTGTRVLQVLLWLSVYSISTVAGSIRLKANCSGSSDLTTIPFRHAAPANPSTCSSLTRKLYSFLFSAMIGLNIHIMFAFGSTWCEYFPRVC